MTDNISDMDDLTMNEDLAPIVDNLSALVMTDNISDMDDLTMNEDLAPIVENQSDEGSAVQTEGVSLFGNVAGMVSFAALAQNSDQAFVSKSDPNTPFSWSGAGSQLFGGGNAGKVGGPQGDEDEVAPSNDIHFEPVVSLPEISVKTDRYRVLSPEDRGILADIYESLWSGMERDEIKSKLLDHNELLDREITLWTSGCCDSSSVFEFHFKSNKMQKESIKEYASLIRDGVCHCQRCTTDPVELRSSSCLCRIAAAIGKAWLIEFLLDQGCHPNRASCCFHYTPIFLAIVRSNYDIVKLLVLRAPDKLSQPNANNETLLHGIVQTQCDEVLELTKIVLGVVTCDVNALNDQRETALKLAVRNDQLEIVRLLLDNGADPNIPSEGGGPTPLGLAVQQDRKEMASALIKGGADVNAVFQVQLGINMTPLVRSIYTHSHVYEHPEFCHATRIEMTRLLLENGANPNLECYSGLFPIVLAGHENCPKLVELLISYGAEVNGADVTGFTALHYAAWYGHIDKVNVLLASGAGPNTLTSCKKTPLALAAHSNHLNCLNILLKHKVNVDNTDKDMNTPMHYLASHGNLEGIQALLDHGAKPDVLNKFNASPLALAAHDNHLNCLNILLKHKVNVDNIDKDMNTPMHYLASHGNLEGIQALLDHGAKPDVLNKFNASPLALAAHHNHLNCLNIMLKHKVNVDNTDKDMNTPMHYLASHGNLEGIQALLDHGAKPDVLNKFNASPLALAAHDNHLNCLNIMLKHKVNVDNTDKEMNTPMHYLASHGNLEGIQALLDHGAKPDVLNKCNASPLALAAHDNHLNCLNILLKHKVNVDNTDKDMNTPMHYLASHGNLEGIQALLDHGANPDVLNKWNASPLWNAIYMKHSEVVCLLVRQNVSLDVKSCGDVTYNYFDEMMQPYDEPRSLLWVAVEREWMDGVKILVQAGYNIWKEGWLLSSEGWLLSEEQDLSEESIVIIRHLQALPHTPQSLLSSCRQIIKKFVCSDFEKTVQQFPIPVIMKDYLLLKDLKLPDCRGGLMFKPSVGI